MHAGGPFHSTERDNGEVVSYRNTFEGLLDVPRDPDNPKPRQATISRRMRLDLRCKCDLLTFVSPSYFRPKATSAIVVPIAFEMQ